eukprot:122865_1
MCYFWLCNVGCTLSTSTQHIQCDTIQNYGEGTINVRGIQQHSNLYKFNENKILLQNWSTRDCKFKSNDAKIQIFLSILIMHYKLYPADNKTIDNKTHTITDLKFIP